MMKFSETHTENKNYHRSLDIHSKYARVKRSNHAR